MHNISRSAHSVIDYSSDFSGFLSGLTYPVALVSPALFDIMGSRATHEELERAFVSLGFRELWTISFNKYDFIDNLEREAAQCEEGLTLFSACPFARSLIASEYPHIFSRMTLALPPADRTARAAREAHPDATLFWVSPCSTRAEALLKKDHAEADSLPSVDYLVPLHTVFPAILAELGLEPGSFTREDDECDDGSCEDGACKDACATGRVEVIATIAAMRSYLDANASPARKSSDDKPIVEFIACEHGCSDGDWAPQFEKDASSCRACAEIPSMILTR